MDSSHLKPEQIEAMVRVFGRHLRYLNNLCGRMQKLRFPDDDPLWREAYAAKQAAQRVFDAARFAGQKYLESVIAADSPPADFDCAAALQRHVAARLSRQSPASAVAEKS